MESPLVSPPRGGMINSIVKNRKMSLKYKDIEVKSEYAPVWYVCGLGKTCLIGKNRLAKNNKKKWNNKVRLYKTMK